MSISRTGKLNKRLRFEKISSVAKGPNGQEIPEWTEVKKVWFAFKQKFIKEVKDDMGSAAESTQTIIIRHSKSKVPQLDWRIVHKGAVYEIEDINPDEENQAFTVLIVKEVK